MGGGVAGWLTPGWSIYVKENAPTIAQPGYVKSMLDAGEDPKPLVLEECKPQCTYWKKKLERCEVQLAIVIKFDPTKTCMYPMRDYASCVEACAQPVIHNQLKM